MNKALKEFWSGFSLCFKVFMDVEIDYEAIGFITGIVIICTSLSIILFLMVWWLQ